MTTLTRMTSPDAPAPVADEFDEHQLGAYIRELRVKQNISMRKLASLADVSVSFLSQVERGTASPSIASLMRIAKALDQTIGSLFESRSSNRLVRAGEGPRLIHPSRQWDEELLSPREFTKLQVIRSTLAVKGSTGSELLSYGPSETSMLVEKGSVEVEIGGESYRLEVGDCLSYDPSAQHSIVNAGRVPAVLVFASSSPVY
jgi:XRE family transcriptional regulator, regulator of sulfur utilization